MKQWWQCTEGKFLLMQLGQLVLLIGAGAWVWYREVFKYVPVAGEGGRCLTGVGAFEFVVLLAILFSVPFILWQKRLLSLRLNGYASWVGAPWVAGLVGLSPTWALLGL